MAERKKYILTWNEVNNGLLRDITLSVDLGELAPSGLEAAMAWAGFEYLKGLSAEDLGIKKKQHKVTMYSEGRTEIISWSAK